MSEAERDGAHLVARRATIRMLVVTVSLALILVGFILLLVGVNPLSAYRSLWQGAFGSRQAIGETLLRFTLYSMIGLGLIPALRANVISVGAEGQVAMGALLAGVTALAIRSAPGPLVITLAAMAGAIGGALWALIPALMRAALGVNEILTTLAFNFIARSVLSWLLSGPVQGPGANLNQSEFTPENTWLPSLLPGTRAHAGLLLALLFAVGIAIFRRTAGGYRLEVYGANPSLARVAGIRPARIIVGTMLLSGAAAGLGGWMQVAGVDQAVYEMVGRGTAFVGFLVVFLGGARVGGTLAAAFFFAALSTGGEFMQVGAGVAPEMIDVIQGLVLLLLASQLRRANAA